MKAYVAFLVFAVAQLTAAPREIGEAERDAVGIAAVYLAQGPEAVWESLSGDAPLRALPKEEAVHEIATRLGPRDGATWTLQTIEGHNEAAFRVRWPSGYEDGLRFRMKRSGSKWVLHELLTLAENPVVPSIERDSVMAGEHTTAGTEMTQPPVPVERLPLRPPDVTQEPGGRERPPFHRDGEGVEGSRPSGDASTSLGNTRLPWPLIAIAVVFVLIGFGLTRYRLLAIALVAVGLAIGAAAAYQVYQRRTMPVSVPFAELRGLERFRAALARGADAKIPLDANERARHVATLWLLQSGAAVDVAGTRSDPIAGLSSVVRTPMAELVRARLALSTASEAEAARAFDRAASLPPVRDDVLQEAAASLSEERAAIFAARLRNMGSRDADTYYRAGTYDEFRIAWALDPKPREELVRNPDLFALLTKDFRTKPLVSFYSATEPARRSSVLGKHALAWPPGAKAFVTGERLRVEIGNASFDVPNGASLAPPNAQVVPATHGEQQRDAAALRDARELLEKTGEAAPRTRVVRAARALARHNRWDDVLKITEKDSAPELVLLRMRALLRARRIDDARALAGQKIEDPGAILAIAEALSNAGEWSSAELLFRSVEDDKQKDVVAMRLKQLELRRALATTAQVVATKNFDIRHDASINPAVALRIGDLLEAELDRLRAKLPPVELRRVAVNVLRWEEFSTDITFSDHILGLYDGEILYPFAAVAQFKPEVVSIITHELTHAIVAQVTHDNAPRWFQEGVATRMELVPKHENAFRDRQPALVLPVSLLDAVMERNADPSAYVVAQTFIRFLEDQHGADAIAKLASEFARGTTTDDALTKLTGKSLDAINADFRQWGFHHNADFALTEPWPYGNFYSLGVDPRIRAGFKFKEQ